MAGTCLNVHGRLKETRNNEKLKHQTIIQNSSLHVKSADIVND